MLVDYAKKELELAGLFDKESDYDGKLGKAALELVEKFADQGHSGFSASMVTQIVTKLMQYEPLTPLTGEDDEWMDVDGQGLYQNKRYPSVFKNKERGAYNIEGRVFRNRDGIAYTSKDSWVDITFPYTPTKEIVDVD